MRRKKRVIAPKTNWKIYMGKFLYCCDPWNRKRSQRSSRKLYAKLWNRLRDTCYTTCYLRELCKLVSPSFSKFLLQFKSSPDPSHFISQISFGKRRIRYRTTLNFHHSIFGSDPALSDIDSKNKMAWVWTTGSTDPPRIV